MRRSSRDTLNPPPAASWTRLDPNDSSSFALFEALSTSSTRLSAANSSRRPSLSQCGVEPKSVSLVYVPCFSDRIQTPVPRTWPARRVPSGDQDHGVKWPSRPSSGGSAVSVFSFQGCAGSKMKDRVTSLPAKRPPSGDQTGKPTGGPDPAVTWRKPPPSASTTQMFQRPLLVE